MFTVGAFLASLYAQPGSLKHTLCLSLLHLTANLETLPTLRIPYMAIVGVVPVVTQAHTKVTGWGGGGGGGGGGS